MFDVIKSTIDRVGVSFTYATNQIPDESDVLFMDGHVEFMRYPGKFPIASVAAANMWNTGWD